MIYFSRISIKFCTFVQYNVICALVYIIYIRYKF